MMTSCNKAATAKQKSGSVKRRHRLLEPLWSVLSRVEFPITVYTSIINSGFEL